MSLYKTRGLEGLVDQQVRRWEMSRGGRRKPTASEAEAMPVITVSRQFGALGAELARIVSQRLGYSCWDQELLHEIAQHHRLPEEMFASLDEHSRDAIKERVAVFGKGRQATFGDYVSALLRVLHTIAEHGRAVVVGRGAQFVLDRQRTLCVRAICAIDTRAERLSTRKGISIPDARSLIEQVDGERRAFSRESFSREVEDPSAYDLLINTGTLTVEQAADVVIAAHDARFGKPA